MERFTTNFVFPTRGKDVSDEALSKASEEIATETEKLLTELRVELNKLRRDPGLNALGLKAKSMERVQATAERVSEMIQTRRDKLRTALDQMEGKALAPQVRLTIPPGADPADWRQAEAEARTKLYDLDPVQRRRVYEKAIRDGDRQTVRAIELAPTAFPLVDAEVLDQGRHLWAETHHADTYELIRQQRSTMETLATTGKIAASALSEMAGGTHVGPDPLADRLKAASKWVKKAVGA
jgi:hypothetical protein